jgi:hypothetical protein
MTGQPHFGPDAYVVRFRWWGPIIPFVLGGGIVSAFIVERWWRRPQKSSDPVALIHGSGPGFGDWVGYGLSWFGLVVGVGALVTGVLWTRRALQRVVAFAVDQRGVYWCPAGDPDEGRWFSWGEISVIEVWTRESGDIHTSGIALHGPPGPEGRTQRLVSESAGGWSVSLRRLRPAVGRFAPHVTVR